MNISRAKMDGSSDEDRPEPENPLMAYVDPDLLASRVQRIFPTFSQSISGLVPLIGKDQEVIYLLQSLAEGLADHEMAAMKIAAVALHDDPDTSSDKRLIITRLIGIVHDHTMASSMSRRDNQEYDHAEQRITAIYLRSLITRHGVRP